jgi:hypothetical protein
LSEMCRFAQTAARRPPRLAQALICQPMGTCRTTPQDR